MSNILIFDLDDTLDPEITYVQSGFHAVANALRKLYGWDTKQSFSYMQDVLSTMGRGAVFDALLDFHGVLTKKPCVTAYLCIVSIIRASNYQLSLMCFLVAGQANHILLLMAIR